MCELLELDQELASSTSQLVEGLTSKLPLGMVADPADLSTVRLQKVVVLAPVIICAAAPDKVTVPSRCVKVPSLSQSPRPGWVPAPKVRPLGENGSSENIWVTWLFSRDRVSRSKNCRSTVTSELRAELRPPVRKRSFNRGDKPTTHQCPAA